MFFESLKTMDPQKIQVQKNLVRVRLFSIELRLRRELLYWPTKKMTPPIYSTDVARLFTRLVKSQGDAHRYVLLS